MKNTMLPIISLLALGTFAPAADPGDAQWEKMFQVMYGLPRPARDSRLEQLKSLIDQGADVNMAIARANKSLHRTAASRCGCNGPDSWPPSMTLVR